MGMIAQLAEQFILANTLIRINIVIGCQFMVVGQDSQEPTTNY